MATRSLEYRIQSLAELPFMVLENVHWRPQAAKFREKDKAELRRKDPRGAKNYQLLRHAWAREETWINCGLNALMMALPQPILADVLRTHMHGFELSDGQVAKLGSAGIASIVGDPDLVLHGANSCVFAESKVAAHAKSHTYSFDQFTKYMALGTIATCATEPGFKRSVAHLLLTPTLDPNEFCSDAAQWSPRVENGRLEVDPAKINVKDTRRRFHNFASWRRYLSNTLASAKVTMRCPLDDSAVAKLLASDEPVLVPTFVVTYEAMLCSIQKRCAEVGMASHAHAADTLRSLVYGEYRPMSDPD